MNEFFQIVQNNISQAQAADAKKKEILAVLESASDAVKQLTNGRVSIVKDHAINGFTDVLLKNLSLFLQGSKKSTVLVLRHISYPSVKDVQIAVWEEEVTGYPLTIGFGGSTHRCTGKTGLISTLKDLLAHPEVGLAIEKLRQTPVRASKPGETKTPASRGISTSLQQQKAFGLSGTDTTSQETAAMAGISKSVATGSKKATSSSEKAAKTAGVLKSEGNKSVSGKAAARPKAPKK